MKAESESAKFTPGPLYSRGREVVKHTGAGECVIALATAVGSNPEANAAFFAASPQMYEALQCVCELCDDGDADSLTRQAAKVARAALRAAEGA